MSSAVVGGFSRRQEAFTVLIASDIVGFGAFGLFVPKMRFMVG